MDNRRLFLAAFISLGLVILWGRFVQPPVAVQPQTPATGLEASGDSALGSSDLAGSDLAGSDASARASGVESSAAAGSTGEAAGVEVEGETAAPDVAASIQESVVVDTDRYRAEFSNEGAWMTSFLLKHELDENGAPLELVRARGNADGYPFALVDGAGQTLFGDALFAVERTEIGNGSVSLSFSYRADGMGATKRFTLKPSGLIDVGVDVSGLGDWQLAVGPGIRDLTAEQSEDRFRQPKSGYRLAGDVETIGPDKQREDTVLPAQGLEWVTLEDNYFLIAVVPGSGSVGVTIRPVRERAEVAVDERRFLSVDEAAQAGEEELIADQELLIRPSGDSLEVVSFLGAKRYQQLADLPYGLQETVRWGFFGFLARPLYYGLEWIYERLPNYGWAIVIMTLVIKLIFFPLTHKGQKSMARMQELSPKIQAIRNKFRSKLKDKHGRPNREAQHQMNEELLGLYRKEGVNPAGGCVPMLIQIPVFFAFFKLLQSAVELRNAPWLGWVQDLSAPDPWLVLPALMLVTALLLQKVTPAPPDPMQRRIIQMMPIVFSAVSITFPAGLVLYWTTNNVLTMIQQWFYYRSRGQDAKPAAVKASGGAGSGKSSSRGKRQTKS